MGDNVIIVHPCTWDWLDAIDGGGTGDDPSWQIDEQPIVFNRYITEIDGNHVTVDAPVFNHLDRSLSQSFLYRWDRAGLVAEVGVEDLRIDIAFAGDIDEDEDHAMTAILLFGVEDAWVRRCTMLHFWFAGVATVETSRATITQCTAIDPASPITGGRRYNFATGRHSQQILFVDCFAGNARHAYTSNGTSSVSGVVFLRGTAQFSHAASEGHRRWSQGLLYDNHVELAPNHHTVLGLYYRGDSGPVTVGPPFTRWPGTATWPARRWLFRSRQPRRTTPLAAPAMSPAWTFRSASWPHRRNRPTED